MESLTQIKDHNKEPHYLYGIPNPYFLFFTLHIGAHWHCFLCIPCQRPLCQPKQKHRNTCIKDCFSCLDFQDILMTEVDWQPSSESVKFQILEIWRRYMLLGWPSSQLRTAFENRHILKIPSGFFLKQYSQYFLDCCPNTCACVIVSICIINTAHGQLFLTRRVPALEKVIHHP